MTTTPDTTTPDTTAPNTVDLSAPVAIIGLRDAAHHNRISPLLCDTVTTGLRRAARRPDIRVVVLEGLPDVFCAGGSAERMLGGRQGRVDEVWQLLCSIMDCPIPVVAAAQGHALGGGLLLALCCDVTVLSERSRYAANFLAYGFTPIVGATYLLPAVLGRALGTEMLYTARSYRGRELAERGAGVAVTGHQQVPGHARRTALHIAQAPRDCLELAKAQLVAPVRAGARAALRAELPAHETTVTGAEARRRIRALHGADPGVGS